MKVYFTASTTGDGEYQKQYQRIISFLKKNHHLTSGEQIIKAKELAKDEKLGWKKVRKICPRPGYCGKKPSAPKGGGKDVPVVGKK